MNFRVPFLALALLSIAATGDPCTSDSTGVGAEVDAGPNGAVCEVSVNTPCCVAVAQQCTDNNDCCSGNCSGSNNGEAGFESESSFCAEPVNESCTVALSSRCNTGQCECASDNDCCLGNCVEATLPGTRGKRCCLETGSPCDAPADCCSLTCTGEGGQGQCE
jgi:hypothetical protein